MQRHTTRDILEETQMYYIITKCFLNMREIMILLIQKMCLSGLNSTRARKEIPTGKKNCKPLYKKTIKTNDILIWKMEPEKWLFQFRVKHIY